LAVAHLVHACPSRTRLSVAELKGQAAPLTSLCDALSELEGVERVEARPLTGSLIVTHGGDTRALLGSIAEAGLLEIREAPEPHDPGAEASAWQEWLDRRLEEVGGKNINLKGVAALAFFAMALRQIAAGRVMPPAATALWYGLSLLLLTRASPHGGPDGDGE
jgi:hypothetical protein